MSYLSNHFPTLGSKVIFLFFASYAMLFSTSPNLIQWGEVFLIFAVFLIFVYLLKSVKASYAEYARLALVIVILCLYFFYGVLENGSSVYRDLVFFIFLIFPIALAHTPAAKFIAESPDIYAYIAFAGSILAFRNILPYFDAYESFGFGMLRPNRYYLGSDAIVLFAMFFSIYLIFTNKFKLIIIGLFIFISTFLSGFFDGYRGYMLLFFLMLFSHYIFYKKYSYLALCLIPVFFVLPDLLDPIVSKTSRVLDNGRLSEIVYILSALGGEIPIFGKGIGATIYTPIFESESHIQHGLLPYLVVRFGLFGLFVFLYIMFFLLRSFYNSFVYRDYLLLSLTISLGYFVLLQAGFKRLDFGMLLFVLHCKLALYSSRGLLRSCLTSKERNINSA